jgi:hypothetical protein
LYADYLTWWADARSVLTLGCFEEELDVARSLPELVGKTRKFGDRYYGVGLKDTAPKILVSPRRVRGQWA